MARRLLLLALVLAACRTDPPQATPDADGPDTTAASEAPPDTVSTDQPPSPPPTPFDAAEVVFDTIEPPEQVVQIPPRPAPPSAPTPGARPAPTPPPAASGSCDVRATEGYCFTYTGDGWTPETARDQCASAPDATFGAGTCPLQGRIATCTFERPSAPGREILYTYYAPYDPTLAELACPGTFTRIE